MPEPGEYPIAGAAFHALARHEIAPLRHGVDDALTAPWRSQPLPCPDERWRPRRGRRWSFRVEARGLAPRRSDKIHRQPRLTFLAPDIVASILAGKQPAGLNANKLMADTRLPLDWSEQRIALEFA